jgi:uncharacterized OB-fold protein
VTKRTECDTMKNAMNEAWKVLKAREDEIVGFECKNCGGHFDAPAGMGRNAHNACPHCRAAMQQPGFEPQY